MGTSEPKACEGPGLAALRILKLWERAAILGKLSGV